MGSVFAGYREAAFALGNVELKGSRKAVFSIVEGGGIGYFPDHFGVEGFVCHFSDDGFEIEPLVCFGDCADEFIVGEGGVCADEGVDFGLGYFFVVGQFEWRELRV